MIIDNYRKQVITHQQNIAKLQADVGRLAVKAAAAMKKKNDARTAASRSTSLSARNVKLREADRQAGEHGKVLVEIAKVEGKIAEEHRRMTIAQGRLELEVSREQKQQDATQKKREAEVRAHERERQRANQARERQMHEIGQGLARHEDLHVQTARQIEMLKALPAKITVLFFASDPGSTSSDKLALDEEARLIQNSIRASAHRESIDFQTRWAVRPGDILQAINELNPTVVHFSGHGTQADALVLQDDHGRPKFVAKEAIVSAIAFSSESVKLVFFNTCFSFNQAQSCIKNINAAIGMSREIGDQGARVFAAQFYNAIGFGRSIPKAFQQAVAALMMEDLEQRDIPQLFVNEELSEEELTLVMPHVV
ncbi:hypothetical protein I5L59_02125 [Pseudomonas moraviensis]|uniref:hypothetical protein n=1 Tax=Pseudomonas moraviensis TaxID=321662 RepID=UPI0018D6D926|nr:hypothetical protein [Pseudomonas moraviensis]MBH3442376.1 hypothetical protein [Pseudomonas moraviensis]